MGIQGLTKLLSDECPECMKEVDLKGYTGRIVAVDASMALYQFLIAVRSGGDGQVAMMLTNEAGEITSHIQGMFNRTIRMMSSGVRPVYVFDGKPPTLKSGELAARAKKRAKAEADLKNAEESGTVEDIDKFQKRLTKVTSQHVDDVKTLLTLMGVPWIVAPCEAEAQCSALARAGKVFGTATEDMDALTFKTPRLIRRMTFSAAKELPILEINYEKVLEGLGLTHDQFVDLCILCGCDYTETIRGVGPKTALKLVREQGSIERILDHLKRTNEKLYAGVPHTWLFPSDKPKDSSEESKMSEQKEENKEEKEDLAKEAEEPTDTDEQKMQDKEDLAKEGEEPADTDEQKMQDQGDTKEEESMDTTPVWEPMYVEARRLFNEHEVSDCADLQLKWKDPDDEGLTKFLVETSGFNPDRVAGGLKRLKSSKQLTSQRRMDSFFKVLAPKPGSASKKSGKDKGKKGAAKASAGKKGKFSGKRR